MEAKSSNEVKLLVEMSYTEVCTLANALNEVVNGIEIVEFETRLGATPEEAEELMRQLHNLLDTATLPESG